MTAASTPTQLGRCDRFEFECRQPKKCIPNWRRCDGHQDCQDGQDEANCREWSAGPSAPGEAPGEQDSSCLCFGSHINKFWPYASILEIGKLSFKEGHIVRSRLEHLLSIFFVQNCDLLIITMWKVLVRRNTPKQHRN